MNTETLEEFEPTEEPQGTRATGAERLGSAIQNEPISALELGPAVTVPLDATLREVVEVLQRRHIGCVLVVTEDGKLAGIFTERDLLERIAGRPLDWSSARVADHMTHEPETLRPEDKIAWALHLMHMGGYRHVPLTDVAGRPVGVVSVKDIVEFICELFPAEILNLPPDPHQEPGPVYSGGGQD